MKTEHYKFSFSDDCGVCGEQYDMTYFDHDLDKFVCDECSNQLAFAAAALLGVVEVSEPYRPKMRKG
jgi:recombinational DNA repair protein (RecF pathway)